MDFTFCAEKPSEDSINTSECAVFRREGDSGQ